MHNGLFQIDWESINQKKTVVYPHFDSVAMDVDANWSLFVVVSVNAAPAKPRPLSATLPPTKLVGQVTAEPTGEGFGCTHLTVTRNKLSRPNQTGTLTRLCDCPLHLLRLRAHTVWEALLNSLSLLAATRY